MYVHDLQLFRRLDEAEAGEHWPGHSEPIWCDLSSTYMAASLALIPFKMWTSSGKFRQYSQNYRTIISIPAAQFWVLFSKDTKAVVYVEEQSKLSDEKLGIIL
jgi:hypothetical protein